MKKYILVGLVVIAAISLTACSSNSTSSTTSPEPTTATAANPTSTTTETAYKDGSYDATGSYTSPGGAEEIEVKLTIKDNIVTDSEVISKATRPESKNYQSQFVDGYKAQVIGKNINEINITKVSGSSLTPKGFEDALTKIKAEAKV